MSNMVDQVIAEYKEEESKETKATEQQPAATPAESTQGESQTQDGQQPSEGGTEGSPKTQTPDSSAPDASQQQHTASTPRTAKDYSSFSPQEKAQYAFNRQLAKQKQKYADDVATIREEFRKELDEIKKGMAHKPEDKPKGRLDFGSDDEYIDYLTERRVNAIMAQRDAESAKKAEEQAEKDREAEEIRKNNEAMSEVFNGHVGEYFKDRDPKEYETFKGKVNLALKNGLGEFLDNAPSVKDFIFTMPDGVAVLNEMLTDRNTFIRVMQASVNPMACTVEMMNVAQQARQRAAQQQQQQAMDLQQQQQPQGMPHIGKPGARQGSGVGRRLDSDADIIDFIRGR